MLNSANLLTIIHSEQVLQSILSMQCYIWPTVDRQKITIYIQ